MTLAASKPLTDAVSLSGISKSYDGRLVLSELSLDVAPGEFLAIVGPSGSGKTTVMRIIGGFETPDAGTVAIAGEDVTFLPAERRKVNTVFQSYALFPHMSVLENVAYGPRMQGASRAARRAKARELLDLVRLSEAAERRPHELSGGMQQRVALARALANGPAVLLLDEPLGALDRKLRDEMQRELRRVQTELGATFIYVTHDQDEAFGMADRLAVMRDGRFEQIGAPAAVYDEPANAWVALFVGSANVFRARVERAGGALVSDYGPIAAGYVAPELGVGDVALVVVRPEATHFLPADAGAATGPNRIAARIVDSVAIGPSLRLRAVTAGGTAFEAVVQRQSDRPGADFAPGSASSSPEALAPGDPVLVTFGAASVRAYRDEPTA
ncbi:ABC transporter ATP-binding protein [Kaistia dalseonensis]|uniref:ABC-type Fe3+/spermidine/putrescine transport system ATPase subunit n=1 Tax=Kaistia dalseonensis TaxID=410840 RepID=A0ABU0H7D4_9HYPH|nr:ABC transporter ATP-binding protein [Kaistia dalseonensis]MCX5495588.1 ABC transporter ATP-binding protein [Kaistia dalseonensis]MDQ0438180.1 ABC-type Fe3+/spermidine/putrescine transport system ATPase subunit [Kaistia dalseonensis]